MIKYSNILGYYEIRLTFLKDWSISPTKSCRLCSPWTEERAYKGTLPPSEMCNTGFVWTKNNTRARSLCFLGSWCSGVLHIVARVIYQRTVDQCVKKGKKRGQPKNCRHGRSMQANRFLGYNQLKWSVVCRLWQLLSYLLGEMVTCWRYKRTGCAKAPIW